jgi:hypothetical protein
MVIFDLPLQTMFFLELSFFNEKSAVALVYGKFKNAVSYVIVTKYAVYHNLTGLHIETLMACCRPTELDAVSFGHLSTILTTKLPDPRLSEVVRGYPNLVSHCNRIHSQFKVPSPVSALL